MSYHNYSAHSTALAARPRWLFLGRESFRLLSARKRVLLELPPALSFAQRRLYLIVAFCRSEICRTRSSISLTRAS